MYVHAKVLSTLWIGLGPGFGLELGFMYGLGLLGLGLGFRFGLRLLGLQLLGLGLGLDRVECNTSIGGVHKARTRVRVTDPHTMDHERYTSSY